jgi:hypothetical protein
MPIDCFEKPVWEIWKATYICMALCMGRKAC